MISENVLLGLKYGGSLFSGAYGLYATLTDLYTVKDGKRRLSVRGYVGLGLLLVGTVVALASDVVSDIAERERGIRQDSIRNEEREAEIAHQKELADSLARALVTLDATSKNVNTTAGLSLQAVTQGRLLAGGLERTAEVVKDNATQTALVLKENRERVNVYRFQFLLSIDPLEFDNRMNRQLLDPPLRAALENAATQELDGSARKEIQRRMSQARRDLRQAIFRQWSVNIRLQKPPSDADQSGYDFYKDLQGEDFLHGVQVFGYLNYDRRTPQGVPTLTAEVVYALPLEGSGRQVTLQDLDDAIVTANLSADKQLVRLVSVDAAAGASSSSAMFGKVSLLENPTGPWTGHWETNYRIPKDYYTTKLQRLSRGN